MQAQAIFIFIFIIQNVCCQSSDENLWVEPHAAWSQLVQEQFNPEDMCGKCQALSVSNTEDALTLAYFKKFVNSVFHRKRLQYDDASALYKRSLLFTLLPAQVDELETVHDVRDLDVLLTKILENVRAAPLYAGDAGCDYAHQGQGVRALITDIFKDFAQLLKISEVQFMLTVMLAIAMGWFVHRRFRFHVAAVILGGFMLFGYFYTYLECNRKMEVEQMIEVFESNQPILDNAQQSWFSRITSYFSSGNIVEQQKQKLRKSSKLNLAYCRPDHVLIMYINDLFLKQLEMLLEKVTHTLTNLRSNLSFPYNYIASLALVCLIGYILKLTFKYVLSPKAWVALLHSRNAADSSAHQPSNLNLSNEAIGDRLSGENLKMLLNVVTSSTTNVAIQQKQLSIVSGVQELMEALQAPRAPGARLNESGSSSGSSSEPTNAITEGFTLINDGGVDDEIIVDNI